jgi:hypothetical protein
MKHLAYVFYKKNSRCVAIATQAGLPAGYTDAAENDDPVIAAANALCDNEFRAECAAGREFDNAAAFAEFSNLLTHKRSQLMRTFVEA